MSVAIIADSIAGLTDETIKQYGIKIVPVNILFEDKVYRNGIDLSPSAAYELLEKAPEQFATSPASPGEYLNAYREQSKSAKDILCITLSSKLSTLYNMAEVAKREVEKELPGTTIEVLDTLTAAGAEGLVVLAAARAATAGKNLREVITVAEEARKSTSLIGILETIRHVYRTGRIPKFASQAGSVLHVKPLITISEGKVHLNGLARTKQQGIDRMLEIMRKKVGKSPVRVSLMHADVPEEAESLRERILSEFDCIELWLTYFSPIMGYATGRGTLVIAFQPELGC